jgi:hypothetical protein
MLGWLPIVMDIYNFVSYSVTQQPNSDKGRLILRFLDHTQLDTHSSDQPVAEAATYTAQTEHQRPKYMSSAEFEPEVSAIERPRTYA